MPRRHVFLFTTGPGLLAAALLALSACAEPMPRAPTAPSGGDGAGPESSAVVLETRVALPEAAGRRQVSLRSFLLPAGADQAACEALEPVAPEEVVAEALVAGQLTLAVLEVGPSGVRLAGRPVAGEDGRPLAPEELAVPLESVEAAPLTGALRRLREVVDATPCATEVPLLLAMDRSEPMEVLLGAVNSANSAGFSEVLTLTEGQVLPPPAPPGARSVVAVVHPGGELEIGTAQSEPMTRGSTDQLGQLLDRALVDRARLGCAALLPVTGATLAEHLAAEQAFAELGVWPATTMGTKEAPPAPDPTPSLPQTRAWRLDEPLTAAGPTPWIVRPAEDGRECAEDGMVTLDGGNAPSSFVGRPLPDLAFQLEGRPAKLSDIPGIRVVDVWATWCGPCVRSLPELERIAETWRERGVTVLALSADDTADDVAAFFEGSPPPVYRLGWAGPEVRDSLGINYVPFTAVLDAQGDVVYAGKAAGSAIDSALAELLGAAM
jgi:thiol-disulfide isomerase/thioredoxin